MTTKEMACGHLTTRVQSKLCPVCSTSVSVHVSKEQEIMWKAKARREEKSLAEWIRQTLDKAVS